MTTNDANRHREQMAAHVAAAGDAPRIAGSAAERHMKAATFHSFAVRDFELAAEATSPEVREEWLQRAQDDAARAWRVTAELPA